MGTFLKLWLVFLVAGSVKADEKVDFDLKDILELAGMIGGLSESSAIHESAASYLMEQKVLYDMQAKLKKEDRYVQKPAPRGANGESIKLDTTFNIDHVEALDEDQETMTVHGSVTLRWKDPRFVWLPEDYGQLRVISRSINMYGSFLPWMPSIRFKTAEPGDVRKSDMAEGLATTLTIGYKGDIVLNKKFTVKSPCNFNYRDFPYDTQRCQLMLVSHNSVRDVWFEYSRDQEKHNARQLRKDGSSPMIGDFVLDWMHVLNAVVKNDLKPDQIKGPWKDGDPVQFKDNNKVAAIVTLSFVRSNDKYFFSFSLPLFGLVLMTQGAMFFDTKKGFFVIGTSFLLLACQLSLIAQRFPTDADGTPLLVVMHYLAVMHALVAFGGLVTLAHFYGPREGLTTARKESPQSYYISEMSARIANFSVLALFVAIIGMGTFYFGAWQQWSGDE